MTTYFSKQIQEQTGEDEKRGEWRVAADQLFSVEFKKRFLLRPRKGIGFNLSEHGVKFATRTRLKKGQRLRLAVYLTSQFPGPRKILLEGIVAHRFRKIAGRYPVGCRLIHVSSESREVIRQFMWWMEVSESRPVRASTYTGYR